VSSYSRDNAAAAGTETVVRGDASYCSSGYKAEDVDVQSNSH